jgi:hypothetical protein
MSIGKVAESHNMTRTKLGLVLSVLVGIVILAVVASPTQAAEEPQLGVVFGFGSHGLEGGQFAEAGAESGGASGIAINQAGAGGVEAGDVYVVDKGHDRVQEFEADGTFVRAFGLDVGGPGVDVCTTVASCGAATASANAGGMGLPTSVAVDQASGVIYVIDQINLRVDVFSAEGIFEGAFGWNVKSTGGAEELQYCTALSGCKAGSAGSGAGQFNDVGTTWAGIAVNPVNGNIVVADGPNQRVDEFSPAVVGGSVKGMAFVRALGWGVQTGAAEFQICTVTCRAASNNPNGENSKAGQFSDLLDDVAVGQTGVIYAADSGSSRVQGFEPDGTPLANPVATGVGSAIAVNRSNGNLLISGRQFGAQSFGVQEYDSSGTQLLKTYLKGLKGLPLGLAVNESTGTPYVDEGEGYEVYVLGETVSPTATVLEPTGVTGTSATFRGVVNPKGLKTQVRFEYSSDGQHWTKVQLAGAGSGEGVLPGTETDESVESEPVAGLEALTEYQIRLVATKIFESGTDVGVGVFTTPAAAPVVSAVSTTSLSADSATLVAQVNPENQATSYHFECVSEAQFVASGYAEAQIVPAGPEPVIVGGQAEVVVATIQSLAPLTTYHCRVRAANATGSAVGDDSTFTTFLAGQSLLPDGRVYEQASPVAKNGGSIQGEPNTIQASSSGDAVTFFTNSGLAGGEGAQEFPLYVARRSPAGDVWATRGLLPPASTGPNAFVRGWDEEIDTVLAEASTPEGLPTLYSRGVEGGSPMEIAARSGGTFFADASILSGGGKVLFETNTALTPGAAKGEKRNVYLWNQASGEVSLVSVTNKGAAPKGGALAGPFDWFQTEDTAEGGAYRGYYDQQSNVLSQDGSVAFFTEAGTGAVFARLNPEAEQSPMSSGGACLEPSLACTVAISASRKTNGSGPKGTDPNGPQPVAFLGATPDGAHAFLLSAEELTNNATTGGDEGADLYRWNEADNSLEDLTPDTEDPRGAEVKGILGASADGSWVYFAAAGKLGDAPSAGTCRRTGENVEGECNLYLWHEGATKFIARLASGGGIEGDYRDWSPIGNILNEPRQNQARVSADGQTILFRSKARLGLFDNQGEPELYRAVNGEPPVCISCSPTGAAPTGAASLEALTEKFASPKYQANFKTRNLSANGKRVFFDSPDQLVSADHNGVNDVYEWEAAGEGSCAGESENGGCLSLISTGSSPRPSYFGDADETGNNVFFLTAQPLVAQDRDELVDIYDARVGGGIPSQQMVEPEPCSGEAGCLPGSTPTPSATAPGRPSGEGNAPTPKKCRKGFKRVTKHGKATCVKTKPHKKRKKGKHHAKKGKHHAKKGKHHAKENGGKAK